MSLDVQPYPVFIRIISPPAAEVFESINQGMRSEIRYILRIFVPRKNLSGIIGDRLVSEQEASCFGMKDWLGNLYQIHHETKIENFTSQEEFLGSLFQYSSFRIPDDMTNFQDAYMMVKAEWFFIRLNPPFNILYPFLFSNHGSTQWHRKTLDITGRVSR